MSYNQNLGQLKQFYDENAPVRDRSSIETWKVVERQHFLNRLIEEDAQTLLEIGAGVGRDSQFFQENGLTVTSTDLSAEMVAHCRAKGLTAHQLDFMQLPQLNQTFDAIFALNCLLHVAQADLQSVLTQIKQRLQPSGLFYYGVYGGNRFEGMREQHEQIPRFFSFYSDEEIQEIVGERFELVEFRRVEVSDTADYHFQSMIWRCL